jgi:hypothetical protein
MSRRWLLHPHECRHVDRRDRECRKGRHQPCRRARWTAASPRLSASRCTSTRSLHSPRCCFPRRSSCGGRSQQVLADTPECDPGKHPLKRGARRALIEAVVGGVGTALLLPPRCERLPARTRTTAFVLARGTARTIAMATKHCRGSAGHRRGSTHRGVRAAVGAEPSDPLLAMSASLADRRERRELRRKRKPGKSRRRPAVAGEQVHGLVLSQPPTGHRPGGLRDWRIAELTRYPPRPALVRARAKVPRVVGLAQRTQDP